MVKEAVRCQSRTLRVIFEKSSDLDLLQNKIQIALQPLGINHSFSGGHATLAKRNGEGPAYWIKQYINNHLPCSVTLPSFTIKEFSLCESDLKTEEYLMRHTSTPRIQLEFRSNGTETFVTYLLLLISCVKLHCKKISLSPNYEGSVRRKRFRGFCLQPI